MMSANEFCKAYGFDLILLDEYERKVKSAFLKYYTHMVLQKL